MKTLEDILAHIDLIQPFIREYGADTWTRLRNTIGIAEATKIIGTPRNEIMSQLRIEYGLTLQQVGDIFGITGERVRQLTPSGLWHHNSEEVHWDIIIDRILRAAISDKDAWHVDKGTIKLAWAKKRFNSDIVHHIGDFHRRYSKLQIILKYKLHIETDGEQLDWLNEQYFKLNKSYENIADDLSRLGIRISTMCVFRNAQALGFKGYAVGKRFDQ